MDLKDYIQGKRHGKEANQLEQEAMDDPFLQDAIDGYDATRGNHNQALDELERRFAQQKKPGKSRVWIWSAAALLLLLIGSQVLLRVLPEKILDTQIASSQQPAETTSQKNESLPEPPARPTTQAEKQITKTENVRAIKGNKSTADRPIEPPSVVAAEELDASPILADKTQPQSIIEVEVAQKQHGAVTVKETNAAKLDLASNQKRVSGRIVDETGEPIIGAIVNIKNTNKGTVTDREGNFAITVAKQESGMLVASYVGMKTMETPLKESVGDITLKSDDMALQEVVVVGYGTQKKAMIVGSVSKIDGKESESQRFEKADFIEYFKQHYNKNLCMEEPIVIVAEFYIDANGRPGNIRVKEISCPQLETEFKRLLLGSPLWSEPNRNVRLKIEL